ncbi:transcriptional regulator [Streptosporangium violaceochromogenes]|nr:transcriptional regulator [Streptosporangium violaceochromogenes]
MAASAERINSAKGILAARLRAIRTDAGLTGRALAAQTSMDHTKISKIENGTQMPSQADVSAWCTACDAEEQITDLIAAIQNIDAMSTQWRRLEESGLGHVQRTVLPPYEKIQWFRIWQCSVVPGLLQTAGYARGHLRAVIDFRGVPDDVDAAVAVRLKRQEVLRDGGKRFAFVVAEPALHAPLAGPEEMLAQIDRLVELTAGVANLSFGIIPAAARPLMTPPENFWIYDTSRVRIDTVPGRLQHRAPGDIAVYERTFERLHGAAVYGHDARRLLEGAAERFHAA